MKEWLICLLLPAIGNIIPDAPPALMWIVFGAALIDGRQEVPARPEKSRYQTCAVRSHSCNVVVIEN